MFFRKRDESFVKKANRLLKEENDSKGSDQAITDGLNFYTEKIRKAIIPYPTADAALVARAMEGIQENIMRNTPQCMPLLAALKMCKTPEMKETRKEEKTRRT